MKKIYFITLVLLSLSLASCREEMEFDESLLEPKLIVNTFFSPDNVMLIKLYHNIPINSDANQSNEILDANVSLFEDGVKIDGLKKYFHFNGYYNENNEWIKGTDSTLSAVVCDQHPSIGKTYELKVESETYGNISCETTIPHKVEIIQLDTFRTVNQTNNHTYTKLNIKLKFKDPIGEENYYRIVLTKTVGEIPVWRADSTDETVQISSRPIANQVHFNDPIFKYNFESPNSMATGNIDNEYGIFTDKLINGTEYETNFYLNPDNDYDDIDSTKGEFLQYNVMLQAITPDMYYYLKSIDLQEYALELPFTEPIPIYTNVQNGIGIIGSFSSSVKNVMIYGKYPKEGVDYYQLSGN